MPSYNTREEFRQRPAIVISRENLGPSHCRDCHQQQQNRHQQEGHHHPPRRRRRQRHFHLPVNEDSMNGSHRCECDNRRPLRAVLAPIQRVALPTCHKGRLVEKRTECYVEGHLSYHHPRLTTVKRNDRTDSRLDVRRIRFEMNARGDNDGRDYARKCDIESCCCDGDSTGGKATDWEDMNDVIRARSSVDHVLTECPFIRRRNGVVGKTVMTERLVHGGGRNSS